MPNKKFMEKKKDVLDSINGSSIEGLSVKVLSKFFYPSDQVGFDSTLALAAVNDKGYLTDVHNAKDTICKDENIRAVAEIVKKIAR